MCSIHVNRGIDCLKSEIDPFGDTACYHFICITCKTLLGHSTR